ncbi:NusG domain II-containing protein [Clostridium sp. LIBA-8841]|uniref:NusG domain II-containing protein n=1 Tax=Clostridium sp. LIBA-8841 TaxID=2987530 RepID=UPI002AC6178E|nr:NusG domain II-containing protein [Clostridium sp. LIBA-8841]MDZ5253174.1 NusG domain II-containing protein [Clostridium sp. LIBA-8841]
MKKWDFLIIIILVIISLMPLGLIIPSNIEGENMKVIISVGGENYKVFELKEETDEKIRVEENGGVNEIYIKGKDVYMHDTNCTDRICIRQGKISKVGESIVCLPNRVFIEIKGEKESEYILSY